MPIEFRCTKCQKLLRTPDGTAGKQARCPECESILTIPSEQPPVPAQEVLPVLADAGAASAPGALPATGVSLNRVAPPAGRRLDFVDVYRRTWTILCRKAVLCFTVVIVATLVDVALVLLDVAMRPLGVLVFLGINSVKVLVDVWINVGMILFFIKVARGEPAGAGDFLLASRWYWRFIGASILCGLAAGAGGLLCLVPGIIIGLMYSQYAYLIVDRDYGVIDSLRKSPELTEGNKLALLGIYSANLSLVMVITVIVVIAAFVSAEAAAPFGGPDVPIAIAIIIEGIVFKPLIYLLGSVCYLVMSGQPTADQPGSERQAV